LNHFCLIADALGINYNSIRVTVSKMLKDGQLIQPECGQKTDPRIVNEIDHTD
jgi:DNA-binding transcriptional regulator PaaX